MCVDSRHHVVAAHVGGIYLITYPPPCVHKWKSALSTPEVLHNVATVIDDGINGFRGGYLVAILPDVVGNLASPSRLEQVYRIQSSHRLLTASASVADSWDASAECLGVVC